MGSSRVSLDLPGGCAHDSLAYVQQDDRGAHDPSLEGSGLGRGTWRWGTSP